MGIVVRKIKILDSEGADNTTTVLCNPLKSRSSYAVCLNVIRAREEERLRGSSFEDCCAVLNKGLCPALKMRDEEIKAGKALYYTPRKKLPVDPVAHPIVEKKERNVFGERPVKTEAVKPKPKKPATAKPITFDTGALVNDLIKKEVEVKPTVKIEEAPVKPEPGESPLQFAKRKADAAKTKVF